MKNIGELLLAARLEKGLTVDRLSYITRIDAKYITALEDNDFKKLPPATFTKGFVRIISTALGKNPDEMVAVFRRDYQIINKAPTLHPHHLHRLHFSRFLNSQILIIGLGALIFLFYLVFQYRAVITPPVLTLKSPLANAVLVSPVSVEGTTVAGATITINDDLKIIPDQQGNFSTRLNLSPGQNDVKVSVTNRFSRTTTKTLSITVLTPE